MISTVSEQQHRIAAAAGTPAKRMIIVMVVVDALLFAAALVASLLVQDPTTSRIILVATALILVLLSLAAMVKVIQLQRDDLATLLVEQHEQHVHSRSAVIFGLAKLAESRDDDTGQHLERIRSYVAALLDVLAADDSSLTPERVAVIIETSSLHDIGKVGIPDSILLKPGPLTDDEFDVIKRHTNIGGDTLFALKQQWDENDFLATACAIAFAHHERWDGTGYPFKLEGDIIPFEARVVALADVYDALTTKRVYKPALSHEEASRIIHEGSGTHFDPAMVAAFDRCEDEFERIARRMREEPTVSIDEAVEAI